MPDRELRRHSARTCTRTRNRARTRTHAHARTRTRARSLDQAGPFQHAYPCSALGASVPRRQCQPTLHAHSCALCIHAGGSPPRRACALHCWVREERAHVCLPMPIDRMPVVVN